MEHVGALLRHWRKRRRMSQQQLADEAEVSPRHLSCLETGKARPSREMVLILTSAMDVPLRERNTVLAAAGFAPAYRETDLSDPRLAHVRQALSFLLRQSEPYGAVVVNRRWDVVMANESVKRLGRLLLGTDIPPKNLLTFTLTDLRPYLVNFDEVARSILHRVHREAVQEADSDLLALHDSLRREVPHLSGHEDWDVHPSLLLPVSFEKNGLRLDFFTTLTTLGTPQDITLSELRIESYFPANPETDVLVRSLATPS